MLKMESCHTCLSKLVELMGSKVFAFAVTEIQKTVVSISVDSTYTYKYVQ
jgi:hypothetical protein